MTLASKDAAERYALMEQLAKLTCPASAVPNETSSESHEIIDKPVSAKVTEAS